MGKYKSKRKAGRRKNGDGKNKKQKSGSGKWKDIPVVRDNKLFEAYYKGQPNYMKSHEWDAFTAQLRKPLPATFRINSNCTHKEQIRRKLNEDFSFEIGDVIVDGHMIAPPRPMPWYPGGNGWQLGCGKKLLRKSEILKKIHKFIVQETESGNLSRQESVSMLPPFLLGVESHHLVLDMCAAPGSKTAQLLEALAGEDNLVVPKGMVIANDADSRRAYMLTHQVKRIKTAGLVITCHDAQFFPNLIPKKNGPKTDGAPRYAEGIFDRILCDVPCSGDGTMRKNIDLWRKWDTSSGIALHPLQLQIAMRGAGLLKVGGMMVYSTCSFNPVENEAVVAEILRRCGGSLELVDASGMLPKLTRRPGLHSWRVACQKGKGQTEILWVDDFESKPEMYGQHIRKTMFPPSKADAERLNLERCWRMLPHDQDTGGFFVALLKKVKPLEGPKNAPQHVVKSTSEKIFASKTAADKSGSTAGPSGEGSSKVDEDTPADEKVELQRAHPERAHGQDLYAPFMQNEANHASLESIREFYGLKSDFPVKNLFTRSVGGKIVSYVNDAVQYHTMDFEHKGRRAHLVNVGIKVFEKNTRPGVDCPYRLQQDGIGALLPHLTKRVMKVTLQDMAYLLQPSERGFPLIAVSAHSKEQFKNAGPGSCALVLDTSTFECSAEKILAAGLPKDFPIVCWKGEVALSPLVHKHDRGSLYNVVKTAAQELGMPLKDLRDFVYPEKSESAVGEVNQ